MTYGRYNPRITLEQYVQLLRLKQEQEREGVRDGTFQRLVEQWGVPQSTVSTAVCRGIKSYDYKILKSGVRL